MPPVDVLLVSEDPGFLIRARRDLWNAGVQTTACLGPAHTACLLDAEGFCSLAGHADVVIVDSPNSGSFERHTYSIGTGTYADRLARAHPDAVILLAGVPEGYAGGDGEVIQTDTRDQAVDLVLLACKPMQIRPTREETYSEGARS